MNTILHIEIDATYLLDGKTPVRVLKALNRSKTVYSVLAPDKSVDTVPVERLQPQVITDFFQEETISSMETTVHSMPDISND
ncbi:MAG TPA: hypothetical protein VIM75_17435 [Ohtaekwangia sp.]|uniref:hypothetical protein n=1 Tax=Ohtaekwangia sp. TaxID=2066019 RepID=UPI002F93F810